jgi:hypothetical protein
MTEVDWAMGNIYLRVVLATGPNSRVGSGSGSSGNGSYHTKNPDHWKWAGFTTKNPAFQVHNFGFNQVSEFSLYHDMMNM